MGLQSRINIAGGYAWTSGSLTASTRFGATGMPAGSLVLADGTGAGQANFAYRVSISLAATTMVAYDLKGGGGELDERNIAMAATAVKVVVLQVTTPGASTSLRFGPQNQSDAAQLWFPGVTANDYVIVKDKLYMDDARAGWAIGASTKKLCVYNPGAATVAAILFVMGTK
jgi:hypothetical protein